MQKKLLKLTSILFSTLLFALQLAPDSASASTDFPFIEAPLHTVKVTDKRFTPSSQVPVCNANDPTISWDKNSIYKTVIKENFEGDWKKFKKAPGLCKTRHSTQSGQSDELYKIVITYTLNGEKVRTVSHFICDYCGDPFNNNRDDSADEEIYRVPHCESSDTNVSWKKFDVFQKNYKDYFEGSWSDLKRDPGLCKEFESFQRNRFAPRYKIGVTFKLDGEVVRTVDVFVCPGCSRSWGGR